VAEIKQATALHIETLHAGYGHLDILNGVDLTVEQGEFIALMGPNGAGKSTLLKSLYGLTTIKGGKIYWRGDNIAGLRSSQILARGISLCPQGRCNFPLMSVAENLEMAAFGMGKAEAADSRERIYDLFPALKSRAKILAGNMSGGEQQLLEVAMAVLQRPKVLLIDEPSVGLSPAAINIVFDELIRLAETGLTILLVEQNTKKAMQVAKRAVILRLGKVIWDGKPANISHEALGDLFLTGRMRGETQL